MNGMSCRPFKACAVNFVTLTVVLVGRRRDAKSCRLWYNYRILKINENKGVRLKAVRRNVAALCVLAVVAVAGVSLCFTARKGVESDLFALIGDSAEVAGLKAAVDAMAKSARFLVRAESEEGARARLVALGAFGPVSATDGTSVVPAAGRSQPSTFNSQLSTLAPYAHGFLSPTVRGQLKRGEFAAVRDGAVARLFSPMPPVLPPGKDPFLLFTDYVLEMSVPKGEWVMVNVSLTPDEALAALKAVKGADDVRCVGAPFHTAVASERSKSEINVLSAISLFCVVLFGWLLTRSFRFLPLLVLALAAAFCVAAAALFAAFPKPHLITFVFGTTLIGLSVDYVYHALVAQRSIAKPLTFSFLSTVVCFLPLLFSSVGVMRQMAVFTIAGLATVYAGVLTFGVKGETGVTSETSVTGPRSFAVLKLAGMMLLVFAPLFVGLWMFGLGRNQHGNDISRFYRPDPYLAEGERIVAEAVGGAGFIPSAAEQRRNMRLVRKLYAAEGKNLCRMTGLPEKVLELPMKFEAFDPKGAIENLFDGWYSETSRLLSTSLWILAGVLILMFRKECLDFIAPVFVAYTAVSGLLMCMGETLNFFAQICFFIFIGLGLDYCVFRWHARRHPHQPTERAVWYAFLTSLVGFGLLGFTEFAVTRLMGITLAAGLAVSYLAAKLCSGVMGKMPPASCPPTLNSKLPTPWHEQDEQCASRFWMQFMWHSYAWFGKSFQKLIFLFAMPFIYLFARPPRIALRKFYAVLSGFTGRTVRATHWRLFRHMLGFAWSLMDKTDAATLKKCLPEMDVRDDAGWRAFRGLVDSGKGAFILCTHVGTIGVLPALPIRLGGRVPKVHAFQQMGHDAVFTKVFMRHFDHSAIELHAVEDIGVETAVAMQEAIARGELVIMAGDRTSAGSGSVLRSRFLGHECAWPKGAFRFAQLMEAPVFAVTCIRTGWNRYETHVAELNRPAPLEGYVRFLEAETVAHPWQWYHFHDFFGGGDD